MADDNDLKGTPKESDASMPPMMTEPERQRISEAFAERQAAALKVANVGVALVNLQQQVTAAEQQRVAALTEYNNATLEQHRAQATAARHHGLDPSKSWNFNIDTGEILPLVQQPQSPQ